ncbi:hypothetical protein TWF281_007536 [Arthrobotrys megalospora]
MHRCAIALFEFDNFNRDLEEGESDGQLLLWKPDIDPFCEISKGPEAKCCIGDIDTYFPNVDRIMGNIGSLASDECTCFVFPDSNDCTGDWSFMMSGPNNLVPYPAQYMSDPSKHKERLEPNPPPGDVIDSS